MWIALARLVTGRPKRTRRTKSITRNRQGGNRSSINGEAILDDHHPTAASDDLSIILPRLSHGLDRLTRIHRPVRLSLAGVATKAPRVVIETVDRDVPRPPRNRRNGGWARPRRPLRSHAQGKGCGVPVVNERKATVCRFVVGFGSFGTGFSGLDLRHRGDGPLFAVAGTGGPVQTDSVRVGLLE